MSRSFHKYPLSPRGHKCKIINQVIFYTTNAKTWGQRSISRKPANPSKTNWNCILSSTPAGTIMRRLSLHQSVTIICIKIIKRPSLATRRCQWPIPTTVCPSELRCPPTAWLNTSTIPASGSSTRSRDPWNWVVSKESTKWIWVWRRIWSRTRWSNKLCRGHKRRDSSRYRGRDNSSSSQWYCKKAKGCILLL